MPEAHEELWDVEVDVFAPTDGLLGPWLDYEALEREPEVEQARGYGYNGDGEDGAHVTFRAWLRAADEPAVRAVVERVVRRECARVDPDLFDDPRLELAVQLTRLPDSAIKDDEAEPEAGWEPERFDPATWDTYAPTEDGMALRVVSAGFPLDIGRVEVDEQPERVTVTVYDHHPGFMREAGMEYGVAAVAVERRVLVSLKSPLSGRPVFDGTLGHWPSERRPSIAHKHGRRPQATEAELRGAEFRTLEAGGGRSPWATDF